MIKLGIIGTGRIAQRFVTEARRVDGLTIWAVCNPNVKSVRKFAMEYEIPVNMDQVQALVGQVDAVYIASPCETHYDYAKQMLGAGIHVLCEKPLVLERTQAKELFALASEKGCVLMEAIKTAYFPGFQAMMRIAQSGVIGTIKDVEACFTRLTPTNVRELTDEIYGGSFTELGTYGMLPIITLLGTNYEVLSFRSWKTGNGLDGYTKAEVLYKKGFGLAKTGLLVKSEGQLVIAGTKGYILAESPWWLTKKFEIRFEDAAKREVHTYECDGMGLTYEIEVFLQAIKGVGNTPLLQAESICLAGMMEQFLSERRNSVQKAKSAKRMNIWAHRGMSYTYPENTLEAFTAAAKLKGLTGIELDVQLTKDGELVVIHDECVERTTNGTGMVKDYSLQELKQLNIKGLNQSTTIPTLEEVYELLKPYCVEEGLLINVELKNSIIRYEGMEEKVLRLTKQCGMELHVWYSSFLPESMKLMKELNADVKTGVLAVSLEDCIQYAKETNADALHPYIGALSMDVPEDMKELPIRVWNGEELLFRQDGEQKELKWEACLAYGVTDVFTNVPEQYQ